MNNFYEKEWFSLILPSNDTSDINNKPNQFKIVYDKSFIFENTMECAISNLIIPKPLSNVNKIYICSDILNESFVNNSTQCVLRSFKVENDNEREMVFEPLLFVPLRLKEINSISIKIVDENFNSLSFDDGSVIVTLIVRNIEHI